MFSWVEYVRIYFTKTTQQEGEFFKCKNQASACKPGCSKKLLQQDDQARMSTFAAHLTTTSDEIICIMQVEQVAGEKHIFHGWVTVFHGRVTVDFCIWQSFMVEWQLTLAFDSLSWLSDSWLWHLTVDLGVWRSTHWCSLVPWLMLRG